MRTKSSQSAYSDVPFLGGNEAAHFGLQLIGHVNLSLDEQPRT